MDRGTQRSGDLHISLQGSDKSLSLKYKIFA